MNEFVEQIPVLNSEINTLYNLYIQADRLREFYRMILGNRWSGRPPSAMPGLSWGAILGLDAIFDRRPKHFPVKDILVWLRDNITAYTGVTPDPPVTLDELEGQLVRFADAHPPGIEDA